LEAKIVFSQDCIILDACCIINLYASGQMGDILKSISKSVVVAAYVRDEEALRIFCGQAGNGTEEYERIDLQPFIDCGLLRVVTPETEAENITFVNFAATLDDGEAITGAIAPYLLTRGVRIVALLHCKKTLRVKETTPCFPQSHFLH
jgi:hypothetical protein